jgi:hypothetical protein
MRPFTVFSSPNKLSSAAAKALIDRIAIAVR